MTTPEIKVTLDGSVLADALVRYDRVNGPPGTPLTPKAKAPSLDSLRASFRAQLPDVIADLRAKTAEHLTVPQERGYTLQANADNSEAVLRIYDEVWWLGVNALDVARDLDAITAPNIRVEINSPGGDVWDGIAIYNALRNHPAHVTTRVDGMAASIASVIAQAGDRRVMVTGSQMMIHNAWGMTVGDRNDHTDMAAILAQQDDVIAGIYANRAGKSPDDFRALMDAETWLTAETAVEAGLADEVFDPSRQEQPADRVSLADQIAALASSTVFDDVDRLVAAHADPLTGAKREGLVALRDRLEGFLAHGTEPQAPADDTDIEERRIAARRKALEASSLVSSFIAG